MSRKRRKSNYDAKALLQATSGLPDSAASAVHQSSRAIALFRATLATISALIYLNSLNNGFVYDDRRAILENRNVLAPDHFSLAWLKRILTQDFWGSPLNLPASHKSYRPLVTLTFALQAATLKSTSSAFTFHLVNLLLHLCVVDQVFQLARRCLDIGLNQQQVGAKAWSWLSASSIASLLFACHPVHVEAVSSLVGRAELMGALFALLSFHLIGRYLNSGRTAHLAASLLYATAACLSKENCVSILFINLILIMHSASQARYRRVQMQTQQQEPSKSRDQASKRLTVVASVGTVCLLGAYAALRMQLTFRQADDALATNERDRMSALSPLPKFSHSDNPLVQDARQFCLRQQTNLDLEHQSRKKQDLSVDCNNERSLSKLALQILATRILLLPSVNLRQLIYPKALSYDWSLEGLGGLVSSVSDTRILPALLLYLWLGYLVVQKLLGLAGPFESKLRGPANWKKGKHELAITGRDNCSEDDYQSDSTVSVQSVATTKSSDSGFADLDKLAKRKKPRRGDTSLAVSEQSAHNAAHLWALVWLLLPYLPASNLLIPVGFLVAERTLYTPSIGFCLLVAILIEGATKKLSHLLQCQYRQQLAVQKVNLKRYRTPGATAAISAIINKLSGRIELVSAAKLMLIFPLLILGSLKSAQRNLDWRDEISLFRSNLRESSSKSLANLATALSENPQTPSGELVRLYKAALEFEPASPEHHYNL